MESYGDIARDDYHAMATSTDAPKYARRCDTCAHVDDREHFSSGPSVLWLLPWSCPECGARDFVLTPDGS